MSLSVRQYRKDDCVTFKSTKGKFGALSNMAPGFPVYVKSIEILTSEALYQALRFPDYPDIQEAIIRYKSPISAKKHGRTELDKTRNDWEENRFKIMRFCLELKLYQNYNRFSEILLKTQNKAIVEYTDTDKVWGAILEGNYYKGTNALGRLLMEIREKIKTNTFNLNIPQIKNFRLLGEFISSESVVPISHH